MNYQTFTSIELSDFVKCYWILEAEKETKPQKQRIVPDGCMEMIFHCGDLYKQYIDENNYIIQPQCFVFGQITKPLFIEPTGVSAIFAIRFQTNGFAPFSSIPINQMDNRAVPLEELFGTKGKLLENQILNTKTTEERIAIAEEFLLKFLIDKTRIDTTINSSISILLKLKGQLSIDTLSENLNINRRQLERKFSTVIGVSPKQLSKIIRLQNTLNMILNDEFHNFTQLAHENNYYDQAHFIKEFKEFTGVSPKEFYSDNLKLSNLFSGNN